MLTTTESRLLRVLIALRDATGAKTRTPVSEELVAELLRDDAAFAGSVAAELDDLERQGFARITATLSGIRDVQMTAPGKIKAEEFDRLRARATIPPAVPRPARPADATRREDAATAASATASAPVDDWETGVAEVVDAVTQAITLLPPDTTIVIRSLIDDARKAVSSGSRGRARRALTALGGYLGDAASGALGNVLAAQMLALVPQLDD